MNNEYNYQYHTSANTPKARILPDANKTDIVFAFILLLLGIITVDFACFGCFNIGFTICYILWIISGAVYLLLGKHKLTAYSVFCSVAAIALSVTFALYSDEISKLLIFAAIVVLSAITLLSVSKSNYYSDKGFRYIWDIARTILIVPFSFIGQMFASLFPVKDETNPNAKSRGAVVKGIACALPVLAIIIPLLMNADAAFEQTVNAVCGDVPRLIASIVFGTVLFILLFTTLTAHKYGATKLIHREYAKNAKEPASAVAINSFLSIIGTVYIIYLFTQLEYFAGGFLNILPGGYSYSEYAVRGFFEMCVICLINLLIIFVTVCISSKGGNILLRSTKLIELFLCLFSIFIISTGIAKMVMYIDIYGMTKLRILTTVFMFDLACIFIISIIRLFAVRFPYFKTAVITVTLIGTLLSFVNIDTVISKYNVYAYQNGMVNDMDINTLSELSYSSVPEIALLLNDDNGVISSAAANALMKYAQNMGFCIIYHPETFKKEINTAKSKKNRDFREYNYSYSKAYDTIEENAGIINDLCQPCQIY